VIRKAYGDRASNTVGENSSVFFAIRMRQLVSKSTRTVNLCANKTLQFLTGRAS